MKEQISVALSRPGALAQCLSALLCCALVILVVGNVAQAQSGRVPRQKGASPPALPAPPEVTAKPAVTKSQRPVYSLAIVNSVNSARAVVWTSMALEELGDRLKESPTVTVTQKKEEMSRKQAIALAKTKKEDYIVWIQFDVDPSMGRLDPGGESPIVAGLNPGCLVINYTVFAPGTAAVKAQDRVYQAGYQAECTGTIVRPNPQPSDRQRRPVIPT